MTIFQAIVLGIIQGLTEFLPVSSSGHLAIAEQLFGLHTGSDLGFEIAVHGGTFLTVLIYFRKELLALISGLIKREKAAVNWTIYLIVGTIPAALIGIPFKDSIAAIFNYPMLIGIAWCVMAAVLFLAELTAQASVRASRMGISRALVIGAAQAVALIPGISRSGSTIAAGLFTGLKKKSSVTFAFLLSIPAVGGALLLSVKDWVEGKAPFGIEHLIGAIAAALSGYFAVAVMMRVVKSGKLVWFAVYLATIGVATLIFARFL